MRTFSTCREAAPALALLLATGGCSSAPGAAIAQPPEYAPKGEVKCGVTKSQAEPLIVEWPSAARGKLETRARRGLVAVRYIGCEMEVLSRCRPPGAYQYAPMTRKRDRLSIRNEDDLYANLPVYAASFEGKLRSAGELNVRMTLVGRYEADRPGVRRDELSGKACAGATHVISAITTGAFKFFAGADAEVSGGAGALGAGVGAANAAQREILREDGDDAACDKASRDDKEPPEGCGAMLRVEVVPIGEAHAATAAPPATAPWVHAPPATAPWVHAAASGIKGAAERAMTRVELPAVPEGLTEGVMSVTGKASQTEIQRVLRRTLGDARKCYDAGRKRNPRLSGRIKVNLTIGPAGEVVGVTSEGSSLPDAAVQRCVLAKIKAQTFPPPAEGTARVIYPITFTPPAQPAAKPASLDIKRE